MPREKMRKEVIVLGAGFSRSFCKSIPLLNSLMDLLFKEKAKEETEYPDLCKYVRNIFERSNNYSGIRNIESISTVILSKRIFTNETEKMLFAALRFQLLKFIYDELEPFEVDAEDKQSLKDFVCDRILFKKTSDLLRRRTFISLNYDLLLERLGVPVDYGVVGAFSLHQKRKELAVDSISCIKLHGSLNWFRMKGTDAFDIHNVYVVNKHDNLYPIHESDIPVFIPMAHSKDSFLTGSLFSTLWASAISKLSEADDIYFIGYGFPETDINNLFLFLTYKEKIRKIVVYENENSNNLLRLEKIFGKEIIVNREARDFIMDMDL